MTAPATATPPGFLQPLDQPLPVELTGSRQGLLTRYRTFPVFSPAWAQGRTRAWLLVSTAALLLALAPIPLGPPMSDFPLGALVQLLVQFVLPTLLGPWLCARVRQRGWAPQREWWTLVAVIASLVLGVLAFHSWAAEPIKQWVAEQMGAVDETGKRRKVKLAVGVSVIRSDSAASAPEIAAPAANPASAARQTPSEGPEDTVTHAINTLSSAALSFVLGGGMGLAAWRRERAGLAALAKERELKQAQAQRREAELRLSVLAAQVEPHFLFNTLAGVRSAISTDPTRASEMIDRLVDYLRAAIPRLRGHGAAAATLGEQLDIVRAYLGLMHSRMPRLASHIEAPQALLEAPFPPLMLISLVENAVKHGVEPKVGPVQVRVSAQRTEDGRLAVTVADDGAGFDLQQTAGAGLGLSNIRERLQQMHGARASLTLRSQPGGGVAATLTVPLE